jgi:hypothetical protein
VSAEKSASCRDQDPADFRQRFGDVHIREEPRPRLRGRTKHPEKAVLRRERAETCDSEGFPGDRQAGLVNVNAPHIVAIGNIRSNGTLARAAPQIENPHQKLPSRTGLNFFDDAARTF